MFRKMFTRTGALAIAGALAATVALGAPAAASAANETPVAVQSFERGGRDRVGQGQIGARVLIRATANLTGQQPTAVRDALGNGQSLAQFAEANGSSGDAVVQEVITQARERIDQAVERGRISQEFADALVKELTRKATELVNDTTLGERLGRV